MMKPSVMKPSVMEPSVMEPSVMEPSVMEPSSHNAYMSKEIDKIVGALLEIQRLNLTLVKNNKHNRASYADWDDIINVARQPLTNAGILLYPHQRIENGKLVMHSTLIHAASGQWVDAVLLINTSADVNEDYNKAVTTSCTYTKRQLLQAQLALGDEDVATTQASSNIDNDKYTKLQGVFGNDVTALNTLLKEKNIKSLRDVKKTDYINTLTRAVAIMSERNKTIF